MNYVIIWHNEDFTEYTVGVVENNVTSHSKFTDRRLAQQFAEAEAFRLNCGPVVEQK